MFDNKLLHCAVTRSRIMFEWDWISFHEDSFEWGWMPRNCDCLFFSHAESVTGTTPCYWICAC